VSPGLRRPFVALTLVFVSTLPAITTRIYATDEIQYFAYLRSLWFDGDVSFENEYRRFYEAGYGAGAGAGFHETHLVLKTETGLRINFGTIGSAILWAPFYAVADAGVAIARAVPRDGYSYPYIAAVCIGSAVYGFAAIVLSWLAAQRVTAASPWTACLAAACVWLGTPLFFYMYISPVFAHATSAFAVALFVFTWLAVRRHWSLSGLIALAGSAALMVMVREQDVTYIAGPALDYVWQSFGRSPRQLGRTIVAGAAAAVAFGMVCVPQALAYLALNDRLGPSRLVTRKMYWYSPHALEVLASPEHGFIIWTPLALLAIAGLFLGCAALWRASNYEQPNYELPAPRALVVALVTMLAAQVYVLGALDSWSAAGAFGQRRFVSATILLVIGLSAFFAHVRPGWPRALAGAAAALCVYWNLALIAQFGAGLMSRQRLEPAKNAYAAFVTVPAMAPDLLYRYLFDRSSFYRRPPGSEEP
jgi:hypothetical protein